MTDKKPNEEENVLPVDLDEVHEKNVRELDEELEKELDEVVPKDEPKDEEPVDEPEDEPVTPEQKPEVQVPEEVKEEPADVSALEEELHKVSIRNSDGKVQEFASVDDIPDDFEPYSYKDFAVGVNKLTELAIEKKESAREKARLQEEAEAAKRIDAIKKGWDDEIEVLVKNGSLDKEEATQKAEVDAVFELMVEERGAGRQIESFTQAYEIYQFRKMKKEQQENKQKSNDEKKKYGSRIQPGGSPPPTNTKGKVFEAPPAGVSLDQVHEKVLGILQLPLHQYYALMKAISPQAFVLRVFNLIKEYQ